MGLKELARTPGPKFGHFIVEFATPGIGHILKSAGCDFVLFDLEHSVQLRDGQERRALFRGGGACRSSCACPRRNTTTSPAPGHGRRRPHAADGRHARPRRGTSSMR